MRYQPTNGITNGPKRLKTISGFLEVSTNLMTTTSKQGHGEGGGHPLTLIQYGGPWPQGGPERPLREKGKKGKKKKRKGKGKKGKKRKEEKEKTNFKKL